MARYSLIMKNSVYIALVQHGAKMDPPRSLGKLINEILFAYARALPTFEGDLRQPCKFCSMYVDDICINSKSKFYMKPPTFKFGCVEHVKKE